MGLEHGMIEVMEVVVDLRRRQLSLVDDVGGSQRADVETLGKRELVSGMLSQDVELTIEMHRVEGTVFRVVAGSIMGLENNERLDNLGFSGLGSRAEDRTVSWDFSPTNNSKAE